MQTKTKKRIGILRGGAGKHYASSLKKGGEIILYIVENLADKYEPFDILVDRDHIWHFKGMPVSPSDLANRIDVVWNVAHPSFSNILDSLSIPNISNNSFFYALENNQSILREHIKNIELSMPRSAVFPKNAREVFEKFGSPWIVKNYNEVRVIQTFAELTEAINNGDDLTTVEEFIAGKFTPIHSVSKFRGEDVYIFPIFSNPAGAGSQDLFSLSEKERLSNVAKNLHRHIGAKHYLKSDFVLTPRGKIYLLGIDGILDLKTNSHFSQACESVGAKTRDALEHILEKF